MEGLERDLRGEIIDGRFRVEEKLGSGGMGTVWRVQHVVSLQRLALKTLDPACASEEEATQRFLREARSAGALKTRHVVRVIDAQMQHQHQGAPLPFLVMELLEGKNLQQLLDERGRLPPPELAWLAGQLGRALDAAHTQGIVHRDLKPSNVFVAEDDEGQPIVKLCDFGIAKLTGDANALATEAGLPTRTGALLGTPMYLAPELLRGAGAAVPATDQWALGLMCFRALAGVEYFGHVRGFTDLVLTIANDPLVAPSQRAQGLPRGFDAWFLRSCARRPEQRFPDVPAQVAALEQALGRPAPRPIDLRGGPAVDVGTAATAHGLAPLAPRDGAVATRRPPASRRRLYLAGAVVWAACALAALGWLARRGQTPVHATVAPPAPAPTAPQAPAPSTSASAPTPAPTPTPTPAPTEQKAEPTEPKTGATTNAPTRAPARHRRAAAEHRATPRATTLLPKGSACRRSAECASGLCAAETCL